MVSRATRRSRQRRAAIVGVFVLVLAVAGTTSVLWQRSEVAREQAISEARKAEASRLLALAQSRREEDPTEALAYVTKSLELADSQETRLLALGLVEEGPLARELGGAGPRSGYLSFSPDGKHLAVGGRRPEVLVWSEAGGPPKSLLQKEASATAMNKANWASNRLLVTGLRAEANSVRVWRMPEGEQLRTIEFDTPTGYWNAGPGRVYAQSKAPGDPGTLRVLSWRLPDGGAQMLGNIDLSRLRTSNGEFLRNGRGFWYKKGDSLYVRPIPVNGSGRDRLLVRHSSDIVAIGQIPAGDPARLFTADASGETRITEFAGGKPKSVLHIPPLGDEPVLRLPDPTGSWLGDWLSKENRQVRVWDTHAWPQARPLALRRRGGWSSLGTGFEATFHPGGTWLAALTHAMGPGVTFWPLDHKWPQIVDGYRGGRHIEFSPDGRWLATQWFEGRGAQITLQIRLWPVTGSVTNGPRSYDLPSGWRDSVLKLAFDPQMQFIFIAGFRGQKAIVPLDGSAPKWLEGSPEDVTANTAAVSPDGQKVASADITRQQGKKFLRVWNVESGEQQRFELPSSGTGTPFDGGVGHVVFIDNSTLCTSGDGGIRRWDLEEGTNELLFAVQPGNFVATVFASDGSIALIAKNLGRGPSPGDRSPSILDLATGIAQELPQFETNAGSPPLAMAFDATGELVVTGDNDGIVQVGSVSTEDPHLLIGHDGPIDAVAISPDRQWIATTGDDDTLRLWPMPDLAKPPLHTLPKDQLIAKLKSLTNIRVVRDTESEQGWTTELAPFPGWGEIPGQELP